MWICYLIGVILAVIILLYVIFELHYFFRMFLCFLLARYFKRKVHILQETLVKGICITTDIDTLWFHMNNARFIRELDFARVDFYERTGLLRCLKSKGGALALGATTIRYRRFVRLFDRYLISSKIIYWDDKSIFMEHRFISPKDNFINAIIVCKTRLLNCNAEDVMEELLKVSTQNGGGGGGGEEDMRTVKPELPLDVAKWIESNEISSVALRK